MGRLIDATKLKNVFKVTEDSDHCMWTLSGILSEIDDAPTVDAIPRERIEQMVAEIRDVYVGYRHAYEVKHDIMHIIHKYTKEQTENDT